MLFRGQSRAHGGDAKAAETDLEAALSQALAEGHAALAARAAIALAKTVGGDEARIEAAVVWAKLATSLVEPEAIDGAVRAEAFEAMGWVLHRRGDAAQAQGWYERALAAQVELRGSQHVRVVRLHVALAEVALSLGDAAAAEENAEQAVGLCEQGNAGELSLAAARFVLARALSSGARARELAEEALDAYSEHGGHPEREQAVKTWLQPPP